ncbi:MAG TPA: NCS2 family permease, partial [Tepidisphaeraceae bacterium]|nr:NCS2 family permease [Tepidisphaeraceae bacterium]
KLILINIPGAPLQAGSVRDHDATVAIIGLVLTAWLIARKIPGAIVVGIIVSTAVAFPLGVTHWPHTTQSISFANAFHADIRGALRWDLLPLLFAVLMVDFFDTLGTATAVGEQAGLVQKSGRVMNIRQILIVDSLAAAIGGLFGASSVTAYVESAAGVAEGARTGLHSIFVGCFFLIAIVAAPYAGVVPAAATAPALILVGFFMIAQITRIDFEDLETAIPAFLTLITIPLTYSIAHGIGYGFVAFVLIKLLSGKPRDVRPLMYAVAAAFVVYFISEKAHA